MVKRKAPGSPEELISLADWCRTVVRFIASTGTNVPMFADYERAVERAFQRGDLRGLKMVQRDCAEWAKGLRAEERRKLDGLLRAQTRGGLTEKVEAERREAAEILRRGRIESDEEYRLLATRLDEIYADDARKEEVEAINRLLRTKDRPRA